MHRRAGAQSYPQKERRYNEVWEVTWLIACYLTGLQEIKRYLRSFLRSLSSLTNLAVAG